MATRPYHHGALEDALIGAALREVAANGVGSLVLRDLARTVGVSVSACYRHFPSREHLVARVGQLAREQLGKSLLEARDTVANTGPRKNRALRRLEATGHAYVRFAMDNPNLFEAAFTRSTVGPDRPENPSAWGVVDSTIAELVDTGAIPPSRRHEAPLIAWAGVHGLAQIVTASIWPPGVDVEAQIGAVIDGIVRAVQ